jgi:hypothetical protein
MGFDSIVAWTFYYCCFWKLASNCKRRRREGEALYISVVEVVQSVRERYIRVAAIVIVITAGSWHICVVNKYKSIICVVMIKNVPGSVDLGIYGRIAINPLFLIDV